MDESMRNWPPDPRGWFGLVMVVLMIVPSIIALVILVCRSFRRPKGKP